MENIEVFIINLPKRTDRHAKMVTLMNTIGFKNYRFVEPLKVDAEDPIFPNLNKNQLSLNRTVQTKIFPHVQSDKFIVFEDDLMAMIPAQDIIPRLQTIVKELPDDWDMIYLEYCMEMCPMTKAISNTLRKAFTPYCTAAVLYRTSSIPKFTQCMEVEKAQIDFSYVSCIWQNKLSAYIAYPALFAQDVMMQSDLNHIESKSIQYYLNFLVKMYNPDAKTSYPRLPQCMTPSHLAPYIRWENTLLVFFLLVLTCVIASRL